MSMSRLNGWIVAATVTAILVPASESWAGRRGCCSPCASACNADCCGAACGGNACGASNGGACAPAYETVTKTIMVPTTVWEDRVVNKTVMNQENRPREVTVMKNVT